jgi:hypothetical protein
LEENTFGEGGGEKEIWGDGDSETSEVEECSCWSTISAIVEFSLLTQWAEKYKTFLSSLW